MDFRAGASEDVIALLYAAQRHAGTFGGEELAAAAEATRRLAEASGWHLVAADSSGERIVGTASTLGVCRVIDTSRRQDGLDVLVVAGMIAGPYGISQVAERSRSMGARSVHCVYVGGWSGELPGCETVHRLVEPSDWEDNVQTRNSKLTAAGSASGAFSDLRPTRTAR
jgi:hypothetical protein